MNGADPSIPLALLTLSVFLATEPGKWGLQKQKTCGFYSYQIPQKNLCLILIPIFTCKGHMGSLDFENSPGWYKELPPYSTPLGWCQRRPSRELGPSSPLDNHEATPTHHGVGREYVGCSSVVPPLLLTNKVSVEAWWEPGPPPSLSKGDIRRSHLDQKKVQMRFRVSWGNPNAQVSTESYSL